MSSEWISRGIVYLVILPVLAIFFFRWFERSQVYFPRKGEEATPEDIGLVYEAVKLNPEAEVELHAWWIPHENAETAIILCHGNAGNLSGRVESVRALHQMGFHVLAFDYRGYGLSTGKPSEEGTYRDVKSALTWVQSARPQDKIVLYGRSLGGAVALEAAVHTEIHACVLESTFTSVPDMGKKLFPFLPVELLGRIKYDNLSKIGALRCPVLISHSPEDELIPFEMSEELYRAAPSPKCFVRLAGGHNAFPFYVVPEYADWFRDFINDPETCKNNPSFAIHTK